MCSVPKMSLPRHRGRVFYLACLSWCPCIPYHACSPSEPHAPRLWCVANPVVPMHRPPNLSPPASNACTIHPTVPKRRQAKVRIDTYEEQKSKRLENLLCSWGTRPDESKDSSGIFLATCTRGLLAWNRIDHSGSAGLGIVVGRGGGGGLIYPVALATGLESPAPIRPLDG